MECAGHIAEGRDVAGDCRRSLRFMDSATRNASAGTVMKRKCTTGRPWKPSRNTENRTGEKMPKELRPSEVLWGYWAQVVALEENAERLEIQYLEAA